MGSSNFMADKIIIRKKIKEHRKNIDREEKQYLDIAILKKLMQLQIINKSKIGIYLSTNHETSTKYIINHLLSIKHQLYIPIINPYLPRSMFFQEYSHTTKKCKNKYNIYEPIFDAKKTIPPWELDMVLVPLVAFDMKCNRLGMGGGYYDSTFKYINKYTKTQLVGIAYDCQLVPDIPIEEWDLLLKYIITPTKVYKK
jgi:5-formyltetrahydrofolate cyclo-ligase